MLGSRRKKEVSLAKALARKRGAIISVVTKFGEKGREFPWRESGRSAYEILMAEVLLKRTTATAVARVYSDVLRTFPRLTDLYFAPPDAIAEALTPIGLQYQRARSLKKLAIYLVEEEAGKIPRTLPSLLRIPGIGQYSARAILSFSTGIPAAVVDSNVERILSRVFSDSLFGRTSLNSFQTIADSLLPRKHRSFNLGMLDLAAQYCRPKNPRCNECPLRRLCDYYKSNKSHRELIGNDRFRHQSSVRSARIGKGISLVALSKKAGVSKLTIIRIEHGKSRPKPETLNRLSVALGVRLIRP